MVKFSAAAAGKVIGINIAAISNDKWQVLLVEVKFYLKFSLIRRYINQEQFNKIIGLSEEVGKMIWSSLVKLRNKLIN